MTAGFDRHIFYWDVFGECLNYHSILHAHKGAILDLHFGQDGEHIFTGSSDNTVGMFDFATGTRVKRMKGNNKQLRRRITGDVYKPMYWCAYMPM